MCGIAGIHRLTDRPFPRMNEFCGELLSGIEERGRDATGYVGINDNGDVQLQKASCSAYYFNQHRSKISEDSRTVLLHTRWATQGKAAFPENNHPVEFGGIYAVHNGHIWNDSDLFSSLSKDRRGQVDSEAIPALAAARGWDSLPGSLSELEGDLAVALLNVRVPGELVLARGSHSPLVVLQTRHLLVWASSFAAIKQAWTQTLGTMPKHWFYAKEGYGLKVKGAKATESEWEPYRHPVVRTSSYAPARWDAQGWKTSLWEKERDSLLVWDDADERPGLVQKCEDCGDWTDDCDLFHTLGVWSTLCPSCGAWAKECGIVTK